MKYKIPNKEFIKISLDRLTRFKSVSQRYKRVFDDILSKHLIFEGIKISQMNEDEKIELASMIFNSALNEKSDLSINKIIIEDEKKIYHLNESDIKYLTLKLILGRH